MCIRYSWECQEWKDELNTLSSRLQAGAGLKKYLRSEEMTECFPRIHKLECHLMNVLRWYILVVKLLPNSQIRKKILGLRIRKKITFFPFYSFIWQATEFGNLKYSNFTSYYLPDLIISFRMSSQNRALLALQNNLRELLFQGQKENIIWITIASIYSALNICQAWSQTIFASLI